MSMLGPSLPQRRIASPVAAVVAVLLTLAAVGRAGAQQPETKPYDDKLVQLAEILGAVHYLRELCGANDGQLWRDRMRDLIESEGGASALRRAKLTRSFNNGYRSYSRTYQSCSATAQTAINRFLESGAVIADQLVKTVP
ncbi:MAG: TIGR02301 family protein [Hyphomicrobiaceae bacterium]